MISLSSGNITQKKKKFPVDVKVLNTGDVVHNMEELMPIAFEFV